MSLLTIPNTFITGTTINAAPFNANFSAIAVAVNSIDNTQIGAAGIFASQIIPTTAGQATFGSAQLFTFPAGVAAGGPLTATTATLSGLLTGTTATFSGIIASTVASGVVLENIGNATTGQLYLGPIANTGNTSYFGIESSAGGTILSGSSAYATVLGNASAVSLQFATNNAVRQTITSAGLTQFTGAVQAGSATAGAATAGDLWASRSTTTGQLNLGGSATAGTLDFGVTNAGLFTIGAGLIILNGGGINAAGTGGSGSFSGFVQVGTPAGVAAVCGLYSGYGSPNGVISAKNGSLYMRYDGTAAGSTLWYYNSTGASSTGTAWTALTLP